MKTRILTAVLAMTTVLAFAQRKEIRNAEDAVEDGQFAEAKNLLAQAEPLLSEARNRDKEKFYLNKGLAYLGSGENIPVADLLTAAEAFKEAQKLGVEEAEEGLANVSMTLVNSAIKDQEAQEYSKAAEKLIASYELNKQDTAYLYFAASNAVNAKDYDTALKYYLELQDLGYTGVETQFLATNVETGQVESMPKQQRDLMVKSGAYTDPQDQVTESRSGEIAKNIALIYIQNGETEKAIQAMESAKAENPDDNSLLMSEADMYFQMGDTAKYREIIEKVIERDPNNAVLYYNLGVTTGQQGETEQAMEYYRKAIEIDPNMANAYNNMALLTIEKRNPLVEEMNNLGMSAADNKRYEELEKEVMDIYKDAVTYLEKVMELDPTKIETARTLMNIHNVLGNTERAEELKQKIAEMGASQGE